MIYIERFNILPHEDVHLAHYQQLRQYITDVHWLVVIHTTAQAIQYNECPYIVFVMHVTRYRWCEQVLFQPWVPTRLYTHFNFSTTLYIYIVIRLAIEISPIHSNT